MKMLISRQALKGHFEMASNSFLSLKLLKSYENNLRSQN